MVAQSSEKQIQIYISYFFKDIEFVLEFLEYAIDLKNKYPVNFFYYEKLKAGYDWDLIMQRKLYESQIVLFFLSPDALASKYMNEFEIPLALRIAKEGRSYIVPIILRNCEWTLSPLMKFQLLPINAEPVTNYSSREAVWTEIIGKLSTLIEKVMLDSIITQPPPPPPKINEPPPLPSGNDRLTLAYYAMQEQPALFEVLENLDKDTLTNFWHSQLEKTGDKTLKTILGKLAASHPQSKLHPLWVAWMETVFPGKLTP